MKRAKIKTLFVLMVICGVVFGLIYSSLTRAARNYAAEDENAMLIKTLALAADHCMKEEGSIIIEAKFGENGLTQDDRKTIKGLLDLGNQEDLLYNDEKYLYSVILNNEYENDINKSLLCYNDEKPISIIGKLLEKSHKQGYEDELFCNGGAPGLLKVVLWDTSPYYEHSVDGNCQQNISDLREYYLDEDSDASISNRKYVIEIAPGWRDHFKSFLKTVVGIDDYEYLGEVPIWITNNIQYEQDISVIRDKYWRNKDTLDLGCNIGEEQKKDKLPEDADNLIGFYHANDWRIHFYPKSAVPSDKEALYPVTSNIQGQCRSFAESLGANFDSKRLEDSYNLNTISDLAFATQEDQAESCKNDFEDIYDRWLEGNNYSFEGIAWRISEFKIPMRAIVKVANKNEPINFVDRYQVGDRFQEAPDYNNINEEQALKQALRDLIDTFRDQMNNDYGGLGVVLLSGRATKDDMDLSSLLNYLSRFLEKATFIKNEDDGRWYVKVEEGYDYLDGFAQALYTLGDGAMGKTVEWAVGHGDAWGQLVTKYDEYIGATMTLADVGDEGLYSAVYGRLRNYKQYIEFVVDKDRDWLVEPKCIIVDQLLNEMKELGVNIDEGWTPLPPPDSGNWNDGQSSSGSEPSCYDHAGSLGWLLCGVLDFMTGVAETAYDEYVAPALSVSPQLFAENGDSKGTKQAWDVFQGIANILFIILLLVIIFSQLTGVGIDNYGIKKILPKMIVAAVLVNLSYWICLACVDLSNISGNGLQSLFAGLPPNEAVNAVGESVGGGGLISVAILAAIVAAGWMVFTNPAAILALLVSVLGVVIAIFFLFVLLAAREAAIVVLVVISPLAFVCFMLPNTKKLFTKYLKLAEGLLLVYPIAGLLVGGGGYVSRLLLTSGFGNQGLVQAFTAMIVGIVPIFFIPSLLKSSFAALGNLGAKISGMGQKARGWSTGKVRNSDRYKNLQEKGASRAKMRSLARRSGGRIGRDGKFHESRGIRPRALRAKMANTGLGHRLGMDRTMGEAREQLAQSQINRNNAAANMNAALVNAALQDAKTELKDKAMKAEVKVELEPKPELNRDNYKTRLQNEINEAKADNKVKVFGVSEELAESRRRSAVEAQELKAYQDQFAGFNRGQLEDVKKSASRWFSQPGGSQRMSALISAMEANGMERDIFDMIKSNDVSKDAAVMKTLSASNNKVLKAYGKKGQDTDYNAFMKGTGDHSLEGYIKEKGSDFINGLDDKALAEIKNSNSAAISTDMLVEAAAKINSEDAVKEINSMLSESGRKDDIKISGSQLANFNTSTVEALINQAGSTGALHDALVSASNSVASDTRLLSGTSAPVVEMLDAFRASSNLPPMAQFSVRGQQQQSGPQSGPQPGGGGFYDSSGNRLF